MEGRLSACAFVCRLVLREEAGMAACQGETGRWNSEESLHVGDGRFCDRLCRYLEPDCLFLGARFRICGRWNLSRSRQEAPHGHRFWPGTAAGGGIIDTLNLTFETA